MNSITNNDAYEIYIAGQRAEQALAQKLGDTGIFSLCYACRHRVKPAHKLNQKVENRISDKKNPRPDYSLFDITDVVGFRFVTLFRADMIKVAKLLMGMIAHEADIKPNPFVCASVQEVKVFSTSNSFDPVILQLEDLFRSAGLPFSHEPTGAYTSIHLVARLDVRPSLPETHHRCGDYYIPIEIQIRTVFEDAWGEIDHLYYDAREGKVDPSLFSNLEAVNAHLAVLKKFADACAHYADTIKEQGEVQGQSQVGPVTSVGDDDEVIEKFRTLGIPSQLIDNFIKGRNTRDCEKTRKDKVQKFLEAAHIFKTASEDATLQGKKRLFYYYCKMNEALCRVSTGLPSEYPLAKSIYSDLFEEFSDHPILWFRMGLTLGKLGDSQQSIAAYKKSWELVVAGEKRAEVGSDHLPLADYNYLKKTVRRSIGFQYWSIAEYDKSITPNERMRLLELAYLTTTEGYQDNLADNDADIIRTHNNIICYLLDIEKLFEDTGIETRIANISKLCKQSLVVLESKVNPVECQNPLYLETFGRVYFRLGKYDIAKKLVRKNMEICLSSNAPDNLTPNQILELAINAKTMLNKIDVATNRARRKSTKARSRKGSEAAAQAQKKKPNASRTPRTTNRPIAAPTTRKVGKSVRPQMAKRRKVRAS